MSTPASQALYTTTVLFTIFTLVLVALVYACRSLPRPRGAIEPFRRRGVAWTPAMLSVGRIAHARLLKDADTSATGVLSVSDSLAYTLFRATHQLRVSIARRDWVRLFDADALIAQGAFASPHFWLSAAKSSVVESRRVRSDRNRRGGGSVRVLRARVAGRTRDLDVKHTSSPPIDFTIRRDAPIAVEMEGVRAAIDMNAHPPVMMAPRFWTPELLKHDALAGITFVTASSGQPGIVAFRRYRRNWGTILFGVEPRGRTSIAIKQARTSAHVSHSHGASTALRWRSSARVYDAVEFTVTLQSPFAFLIASITPGNLRITAVGGGLESHTFPVPMMNMQSRYLAPHPSHPLQMACWNAYALPYPVGDHLHLASALKERRFH